MFTPCTDIHEIIYVALNLEAEQSVQDRDKPRWPPERLLQPNTYVTADALSSATASADSSKTAPYSAFKFLQQNVKQNYH